MAELPDRFRQQVRDEAQDGRKGKAGSPPEAEARKDRKKQGPQGPGLEEKDPRYGGGGKEDQVKPPRL
jgi:hypothetical protein